MNYLSQQERKTKSSASAVPAVSVVIRESRFKQDYVFERYITKGCVHILVSPSRKVSQLSDQGYAFW